VYVKVETMLPFLNLRPHNPADDASGEIVDAQIVVPDAPYHIDGLYLTRSNLSTSGGTRIEDLGLFTSGPIPSGTLIGFYTGFFMDDEAYDALSGSVKRALGRYAVSSEDKTISPIDPGHPESGVDFMRHPMAASNEPAKSGNNSMANMFAETRVLDTGDAQFECVCMFACRSIPAEVELVWTYGDAYDRVGYENGADCPKPSVLEDPFPMFSATRSQAQGFFKFVAAEVPESSDDGSGSDDDFVP